MYRCQFDLDAGRTAVLGPGDCLVCFQFCGRLVWYVGVHAVPFSDWSNGMGLCVRIGRANILEFAPRSNRISYHLFSIPKSMFNSPQMALWLAGSTRLLHLVVSLTWSRTGARH